MPQLFAFLLLMIVLYIGDAVSIKTKAWISSVFICGVLFVFGYWTIFPKNIVEIAGFPTVVATLLMYLLITNMGTLLSVKELINQWKTIVLAISGILGIMTFLFVIGTFIFDLNTILVSIPPLVGGLVSSLVMSEAAQSVGLTSLSVLAILIYVIQGFAGYPLTSIVLKREGKRKLQEYRNGTWKIDYDEEKKKKAASELDVPKMFKKIPKRYHTDYSRILRLAIVATFAYYVSVWTEPFITISPFVLCLFFGVLATSIGFLEKQPLQKANSFGFAILGLMLFVFDGLKQATPAMLMDLFLPMVGIIVIGVLGMYTFSAIIGRLLGVSKEMAFAVSLTALYGFPADYIITNEVIQSLTSNEEEKEALKSHMLPPMLVAGFVTVTIVSVILAGIFSSILIKL
ncbi:hypothetical protein ACRVLY_002877 [Listeria monocytogenes]|uniref:hypothetical protein n=1 Tax=Listeria monocytogenes TaxID=1639 RepID=UPI000EDA91EC|nr:hypothetical protein [Listeria monocytogenes]EAC7182528.1 hypothetical protein [Listeria monocytogenes]EAC8000836.1 hypothetical protein [Listeria monocytogenes]EAC9519325.1 hypothetical protein [Listeria monocytogenes]EAD0740692.1 hypothetical protein [Listeria monocytogenes]EAD4096267.1 hypothetical protein [Listeria monocytogenes]